MTRLLGKRQRPIGTMTIMAHTSSVYASLVLGLWPSWTFPEGPKCERVAFAEPFKMDDFSAVLSRHHALGSVARNEDSPRRRDRRVASEVLR